jgi:hypothetical protein
MVKVLPGFMTNCSLFRTVDPTPTKAIGAKQEFDVISVLLAGVTFVIGF